MFSCANITSTLCSCIIYIYKLHQLNKNNKHNPLEDKWLLPIAIFVANKQPNNKMISVSMQRIIIHIVHVWYENH